MAAEGSSSGPWEIDPVDIDVSRVELITMRARDLPRDERQILRGIRLGIAAARFSDRTPEERENFVGEMGKDWEKPNRLVGKGKRFRPNQRFRNPRVTVAYDLEDDHRPFGMASAVENVSSTRELPHWQRGRLEPLVRRAEVEKKLRQQKYIGNRHLVLRDFFAEEGRRDVVPMMICELMDRTADFSQPVACYLYDEEQVERNEVADMGFRPVIGSETEHYGFGAEFRPANMVTYRPESVGDVMRSIRMRPGMSELLDVVQSRSIDRS